jgi:chromate transporter
VGYLNSGFLGALFATFGVMLPSFIIVTLALRFITKFKGNRFMDGFLLGVKPAAVGLVAGAAITIASEVLLKEGAAKSDIFADPLGALSLFLVGVFGVTAIMNIKFKINAILLIVTAGLAGAIFMR